MLRRSFLGGIASLLATRAYTEKPLSTVFLEQGCTTGRISSSKPNVMNLPRAANASTIKWRNLSNTAFYVHPGAWDEP